MDYPDKSIRLFLEIADFELHCPTVVRGTLILATHYKNKIFQFVEIIFVFFNVWSALAKIIVYRCNELNEVYHMLYMSTVTQSS